MTAYATAEELDDYVDEAVLDTTAYDAAEAADITKSLNIATLIIDRLNFKGSKTDSTQANQFPRDDDTEVPTDIVQACCLIALALLDGRDPDLDFENQSLVSMGYANVRSTYDRSGREPHTVAGVPSVAAWRLLLPYIRDPRSFDLYRVS